MIWYKIKELEKQLVAGKISDFLTYNYLLAHLLLFALIYNFPATGEPTDSLWVPWIRLVIVLVAISWGIGKTFEINQNGDNRDYFRRLISLSLVSSLRTIVVFFVYAAVMSTALLLADRFGFHLLREGLWGDIWQLVHLVLLLLVYYYILITSFKRINSMRIYEEREGEKI